MPSLSPSSSPALRSARRTSNVQFLLNGLLFATWGVNVPAFKIQQGVGELAVSLAMLAAGVGAFGAMLCAGGLVARFGARAICAASGAVTATAIGLLLWLHAYGAGVFALLVFGFASSLFDVAINAHAAEVEAALARPIMSSCHAFFSIGGLGGAALASVMAAAGVPSRVSTALLGVAAAAVAIAVVPAMLSDRGAQTVEAAGPASRPSGPIALLGVMAAVGLVAEGAVYDWSALYMRQALAAPAALAALAYAAFSIGMATGRFAGDRVRARCGAATLLIASGLLAAGAMGALLLANETVLALAGFALAGVGISNVIPVLFASAARVRGVAPAQAIAGVASLGYVGFLAGPPVIGALAQASSLRAALSLVVVAAVALAGLAWVTRGVTGRASQDPPPGGIEALNPGSQTP